MENNYEKQLYAVEFLHALWSAPNLKRIALIRFAHVLVSIYQELLKYFISNMNRKWTFIKAHMH